MELPLLMLQELFLHLPASCIIAAHRREAAGTLPCSRSRHGWQYIATKLACTRTRTSSNQSYTHLLARMYQSNNLAVKTYTFYITRLLFLGSCWGRGRERVCSSVLGDSRREGRGWSCIYPWHFPMLLLTPYHIPNYYLSMCC